MPIDSERKPTAEELAAIDYEREAPPQEFADPRIYESAYEYETESFFGPLEQYPAYHGDLELQYDSYTESTWHTMADVPYAAQTSMYPTRDTQAGYALPYLPGSSTFVDSRLPGTGDGLAVVVDAQTSTSETRMPWI